jgi:protein tyrosine phosphatase
VTDRDNERDHDCDCDHERDCDYDCDPESDYDCNRDHERDYDYDCDHERDHDYVLDYDYVLDCDYDMAVSSTMTMCQLKHKCVRKYLHIHHLATTWLNGNVENIIAVHCLGGKGRTGTLCVSLMLWTQFFSSADEALLYFQNR